MLRIIAGERRGLHLKAPPGLGTRPLRDRVREALFSILQFEMPGARVLDLFAGSGAVGLEALSRGAVWAAFAEADPGALEVLRQNIAKARYEDRAQVIAGRLPESLARVGPPPRGGASLAFIMPPYGSPIMGAMLTALKDTPGLFATDGRVVYEVDEDEALDVPEGWTVDQERKYGRTRLIFLLRQ